VPHAHKDSSLLMEYVLLAVKLVRDVLIKLLIVQVVFQDTYFYQIHQYVYQFVIVLQDITSMLQA